MLARTPQDTGLPTLSHDDLSDTPAGTERARPSSGAMPLACRCPARSGRCFRSWRVVLVAFLVIGMALPVLPLHVHHGLGLSTFVVGLVTGSQFAASLLSRVWAGRYSDARGAKRAVVAACSRRSWPGSSICFRFFAATPWIRSSILLRTRAARRGGELHHHRRGELGSGTCRTGECRPRHRLGRHGDVRRAGLGAPIGARALCAGGFAAIAAATALAPLVTLLLVAALRPVRCSAAPAPAFWKVAGAVWMPGLGSALSSIGFGVMIAFSSLLSAERGWSPVWLLFSAFAVALVVARFALGQLPDRVGGAKVALVSVFMEAVGLALIWLAPGRVLAATGAALAGFGYALVYPGLGAEAVRRAPPQSRGLAMGAYTVFLDVALGFGSPALGLVAGWRGLGAVFLASAILVLAGAGYRRRSPAHPWRFTHEDRFCMRRSPARSSRRRANASARCRSGTNSRTDWMEIQMKLLAAILASLSVLATAPAAAEPARLREDIRAVAPALEKYRSGVVMGEVWKRPGLSPRDRSIVTLAALITRNQTAEMADYVGIALDNGVKPAEVSEIITHLAFYAGWGNAMTAVSVTKDVFAARKSHPISLRRVAPASAAQRSGRGRPRQASWRSFRRGVSGRGAIHDRRAVPRSLAAARAGAARPKPCDDQLRW